MNQHVLLDSLKTVQRDAALIQSRTATTLDIRLVASRIVGVLTPIILMLDDDAPVNRHPSEPITAQALYELFCQVSGEHARTWEDAPELLKTIYTAAADRLNTEYLASRQQLIRDYRDFVALLNCDWSSVYAIEQQELAQRASILLGKEDE